MKVQRGINHDDSWQVSSIAYDVRVHCSLKKYYDVILS